MKIKKFIEKNFFLIYYAVILLILTCQLVNTRTVKYENNNFGIYQDTIYELKDGHLLENVFFIPEDSPEGITLNYYSKNDIDLTNEKLYITFFDEETDQSFQQNEILLKNEHSERNIYIKFEEKLQAGMHVKMQIYSEGLSDKGILLALSDEFAYGSNTWKDSVLTTQNLCMSIYYKRFEFDYVKPIMYFLAEVLVGIILFVIYKKFGLSIFAPKEIHGKTEKKKISWHKLLLGLVTILGGSYLFFDYVYLNSIEQSINKRNIIVSDSAIEEQSASYIVIQEGDEIAQTFWAEKENLSGVGLPIQYTGKLEGIIKWSLYDLKTDSLVAEKRYELEKMDMSTEFLSDSAEENIKDTLQDYVGLDFQTYLKDSENGQYEIKICFEELVNEIRIDTGLKNIFPLELNGSTVNGGINLATMYSENMFLKTMFTWMITVFVGTVCVIYSILCIYKISVEKIFVMGMLLLGTIYCFLIPSYCVPDEKVHIDTVYHISNTILGINDVPGPSRIYKRAEDVNASKEQTMDVTVDRYRENFFALVDSRNESIEKTYVVDYADNALSNVTVFNYLPAAIGFSVARILGLNYYLMLIFGRVFNLIIITFVMYIGIKKLPFGSETFAVAGLLPISIQQIASCSYDGLIIGAMYVFVGYCYFVLCSKKKSVFDILVLLMMGCYLAGCKGGVYLPIVGLLLVIPMTYKGIKVKYFLGFLVALLPMGVSFLAQFSTKILSMFTRTQASRYSAGKVLEIYNVSYFLENPKKLIRIFQNTFWERGDIFIQEVLGSHLGKLNINIPWFILILFILLLICSAQINSEKKVLLNKICRVYTIFLCVLSALLVMAAMLLAWTTFGSTNIAGVQGRYFLPFVPLLFIQLTSSKISITCKNTSTMVFNAIVLNGMVIGSVLMSVL